MAEASSTIRPGTAMARKERGAAAAAEASLAFSRLSPIRALTRSWDGSAPFTPAWCAQHLPLIDAAMDLRLGEDRRC